MIIGKGFMRFGFIEVKKLLMGSAEDFVVINVNSCVILKGVGGVVSEAFCTPHPHRRLGSRVFNTLIINLFEPQPPECLSLLPFIL